jgi:histone H3/H4
MKIFIKNRNNIERMLINRSRVKEVCGNINVTREFLEEMDKHTEETIKKACKRAVENNRRTVMGRDI